MNCPKCDQPLELYQLHETSLIVGGRLIAQHRLCSTCVDQLVHLVGDFVPPAPIPAAIQDFVPEATPASAQEAQVGLAPQPLPTQPVGVPALPGDLSGPVSPPPASETSSPTSG